MIFGEFELAHLLKWLEDSEIPIPLAILLDRAARGDINEIRGNYGEIIKKRFPHFDWNLLERLYDLGTEELLIIEKQPLIFNKEVWTRFLKERVNGVLKQIFEKTPSNRRIFQIFGSNSAILFGVGVLLKDYNSFIGYHYHNGGSVKEISFLFKKMRQQQVIIQVKNATLNQYNEQAFNQGCFKTPHLAVKPYQ